METYTIYVINKALRPDYPPVNTPPPVETSADADLVRSCRLRASHRTTSAESRLAVPHANGGYTSAWYSSSAHFPYRSAGQLYLMGTGR